MITRSEIINIIVVAHQE